jgi:hypothetical protein
MKLMRLILASASVFAIAGCTSSQRYDMVRNGELRRCATLPETERARCEQRLGDDYRAYRAKYDAVKRESR